MATDSVLPVTVNPPVDPLMDLESILYLQEDIVSPQDDLLSGLLETDKDFLNELLNPQSVPDPFLPAHSLNPSLCSYSPNNDMTAGLSPLQYETSPECLNSFTFNAQSSPVSTTSSDERSTPPSGCGWTSQHAPASFESSADVHIDLEIDGPYQDESSSSNRKTGSLTLSEEEKKLLAEEGIHLPTDMPLTKAEERHLKRVRRKIKNKQSAADSRKRKKEYIDGLEKRVEKCTADNMLYKEKINSLQSENKSLLAQLHKLQTIVSQYSPSKVQSGTFLMVVLLSFSILIVPNFFTHQTNSISNGVSRTLLNVATDDFGNIIDPNTGKIISDTTPTPLPPWRYQSPIIAEHKYKRTYL